MWGAGHAGCLASRKPQPFTKCQFDRFRWLYQSPGFECIMSSAKRVQGFRVYVFRILGCRLSGFRILGFRVVGFRGLGSRASSIQLRPEYLTCHNAMGVRLLVGLTSL